MAHAFIESPFCNRTNGRHVDLIVIHTMEIPERQDTAEGCAQWFRNPRARVSAHYCVDADSIVQCVRDQDVAWHAPGANHDGIGIEHAGTAKQTGRDWADAYSKAMLARSAKLAASLCKKYKIPPVWLYPADLVAGRRGITTHKAVSDAFKRGSHWDPGQGFPVQEYLAMVRRELGTGKSFEALRADPPTLKRGADGWQVKRLQKLLAQRGYDPGKPNGVFGPTTERAVKRFQKTAELEADGICGPLTWKALMHAKARRVAARRTRPRMVPV